MGGAFIFSSRKIKMNNVELWKRFDNILSSIKYKAWTFGAHESVTYPTPPSLIVKKEISINLNMVVQERDNPYQYVYVGNPKKYPASLLHASEREIVHTVMDLVIQSEIHEAYEHFKYKTSRIFDPHHIPLGFNREIDGDKLGANFTAPYHGRVEEGAAYVYSEYASQVAALFDYKSCDLSQQASRTAANGDLYIKYSKPLPQPTPRYT